MESFQCPAPEPPAFKKGRLFEGINAGNAPHRSPLLRRKKTSREATPRTGALCYTREEKKQNTTKEEKQKITRREEEKKKPKKQKKKKKTKKKRKHKRNRIPPNS